MGVALWVVQGLLAVAFLGAGAMKLSQPKKKLAENMSWVEDFSQPAVRLIGAVEVLGAIGLVLTMVGAALTHLRRKEYGNIAVNVVLLVLAAFVAYGRFFVLPA